MSSESVDHSIIEPTILIEEDSSSNKKNKKQENNEEPLRMVHIKEFDIDSIPPHEVSDNSGVKIVVIGKPGTGEMICQ